MIISDVSSGSNVSGSSNSFELTPVDWSPQPNFDKEEVPEEEVKPIFDIGALVANINLTLNEFTEDDREVKAAKKLASSHDFIVHIFEQLSNYPPSQVEKIARKYLEDVGYEKGPRESICNVLRSLCRSSILRSKYVRVVIALEANIHPYLRKSERKNLERLVDEAKKILDVRLPNQLEDLQKYSSEVRKVAGDIAECLSLYYYANEACKECIRVLIPNSIGGRRLYPNCAKNFNNFCQQLDSTQFEREELIGLLSMTPARILEVDRALKSICQKLEPLESSSVSSAFEERERFFSGHYEIVWKMGPALLKEVFLASLPKEKSWCRVAFSFELIRALNKAANLREDWNRYQYALLYPGIVSIFPCLSYRKVPPFPDFEEAFVGNVWAFYTVDIGHLADLGDFIRLFIHSLSEESFQKLKGAEDEVKAFSDSFKTFFGNGATFLTLRQWCLETPALK